MQFWMQEDVSFAASFVALSLVLLAFSFPKKKQRMMKVKVTTKIQRPIVAPILSPTQKQPAEFDQSEDSKPVEETR